MAVVPRRHEHVGGERGEPRGHLPDVQVVDLDHARMARQRLPDRVGVEVARGALEQHEPALAQQAPGGAQHQRRDDERGDRVGLAEAGGEDDRAGDRRAQRRVEVGHHVRAGALDVQRAALRPRQRPRRAEVDRRPEQADHDHDPALDVGRVAEPAHGLDADHAGQHEQRGAVDLRAEDLGAPEAEGEAPGRRPRRQAQRHEGEPDRAGVGEHVRGVGEQRERVRQQARHDLDDHEAEDQPEREPQLAAVGVGRDPVVVMAVVVGHGDRFTACPPPPNPAGSSWGSCSSHAGVRRMWPRTSPRRCPPPAGGRRSSPARSRCPAVPATRASSTAGSTSTPSTLRPRWRPRTRWPPIRPSIPPTRTARARRTWSSPASTTPPTSARSTAWARALAAAGAADADVLHLHHLTPLNEAAARVAPGVPVVGHLHGTELLMLEAIEEGGAEWPHGAAWEARMRAWAGALRAPDRALGHPGRTAPSACSASTPSAASRSPTASTPSCSAPRALDRAAHWRRHLVDEPQGWRPGEEAGSVALRGGGPAGLRRRADAALRRALHRRQARRRC